MELHLSVVSLLLLLQDGQGCKQTNRQWLQRRRQQQHLWSPLSLSASQSVDLHVRPDMCGKTVCSPTAKSSFIKQCSSVGHNFCLLLMAAITANQPALIRAHSRVIPRAIYQGATSTTATAGDKTVYSKGIGKERKERKRIGSRQVQPTEKIVLHHSLSEFHCITLLPY